MPVSFIIGHFLWSIWRNRFIINFDKDTYNRKSDAVLCNWLINIGSVIDIGAMA